MFQYLQLWRKGQTAVAAREANRAQPSPAADQQARLLDDHNTIRKSTYANIAVQSQGIAKEARIQPSTGLMRAYKAGGKVIRSPLSSDQGGTGRARRQVAGGESVMKVINNAGEIGRD
jgi:hypothetical protein